MRRFNEPIQFIILFKINRNRPNSGKLFRKRSFLSTIILYKNRLGSFHIRIRKYKWQKLSNWSESKNKLASKERKRDNIVGDLVISLHSSNFYTRLQGLKRIIKKTYCNTHWRYVLDAYSTCNAQAWSRGT